MKAQAPPLRMKGGGFKTYALSFLGCLLAGVVLLGNDPIHRKLCAGAPLTYPKSCPNRILITRELAESPLDRTDGQCEACSRSIRRRHPTPSTTPVLLPMFPPSPFQVPRNSHARARPKLRLGPPSRRKVLHPLPPFLTQHVHSRIPSPICQPQPHLLLLPSTTAEPCRRHPPRAEGFHGTCQ